MGEGDMDTDKNVDSDGFSLGSDSDADDPPAAAVGSGADAGDSGGASRPRPPMPKLGLAGIGNSGAAAATPLTARKPPGLGLSLGGGGDAPASRSAEPSPPDAANPSGAIPRMSLSEHRPVGLNLGALRDRAREDVDEDKSELQIRREKFAHFEKHCTEIVPGVYVSGEGVAKNRATLDEHGITHVINCVGFVIPNYFEPDLVYKTMWLQDTPDEDISPVLYDCFDFIEEATVERGGRVLVHCSQGVSRSCSVVISYLMWRDGGSYEDTFAAVKEKRGIANPNMGFTCQMLQWAKRIGTEADRAPPHRLYRVAPHNEHDPTYLVAKPCTSCDTSQLDARGAYVVATSARKAFAWVGTSLIDEEFRTVAEKFARQLYRYDGLGPADSRVVTVSGGDEPAEVLEALGVRRRDGEGGGWEGAAGARRESLDDEFAMYERGARSEIAANSGAAIPPPEWARALTKAGGAGLGAAGNPSLSKGWSLKEPATSGSTQSSSHQSPGNLTSGNLARHLSLPPSRDDTASPSSLGIGGLGLDGAGREGREGVGLSESEPMDHSPSKMDHSPSRRERGGDARGDGPTLHEWPSLVRYDMYDGDDLESSGVYLLRKGRNVYVWIGSGVVLEGSDKFVSGGRIGEEAAARLGIRGGARVTVEAEGGESGEFWEAFESGEA